MIPLFAVIGFRTQRNHRFRLWLPLFLAWLLLLPVVLLLLPLFCIACLAGRINPLRALSTAWQILTGLKGTHVEVEDNNSFVLVRII
jgi:uncharacterized membrane protein